MERVYSAQYFCSGCGALRNQGTRRCVSCGRIFHDEVDATETVRALTHPQTKVRYVQRSNFAKFLDGLFTFRWLMIIAGVALVLWCVITFLPDVIGVKTDAIITKLNVLHCTTDCQMEVFYQFTGSNNKVYSGMFHQSFTDTYFHPPVEGSSTPVRYIPSLPFIPPRSPNEWFPIGVLLLGIFGLGVVVFTIRGHIQ